MTVTVDAPVFPPADAVIEAVPAATPETRPDWVTVAMELFELAQVTDAPDGFVVADSCTVALTAIEAVTGFTFTDFIFCEPDPFADLTESPDISSPAGAVAGGSAQVRSATARTAGNAAETSFRIGRPFGFQRR